MTNNDNQTQTVKTVDRMPEETEKIATERINMLTDLVCSAYGLSYNELADRLGVNRSWLTRYRNGGIRQWSSAAVVDLVDMAAVLDGDSILKWLFVEDSSR